MGGTKNKVRASGGVRALKRVKTLIFSVWNFSARP